MLIGMILVAVVNVVTELIWILIVLIMVRILLTWIPGVQGNPIVRLLGRVVDPVIAPFRRVLPTFSGFDFSPLLAIIVLGVVAQILGGLVFAGSVPVLAVLISIVRQLIISIAAFFALLTFIRIVITFFRASRGHPLTWSLLSITTPLVRPFRAIVPRSRVVESAAVAALVAYVAVCVVAEFGLGALMQAVS
jgi:YggT family protein